MFFKKRKGKPEEQKNQNEYFAYRDALTGQLNRAFACKEFEKLKGDKSYGCVMVHINISGSPDAQEIENCIMKTAQIICSVTSYEVARVEDEYFVVFAKECFELADKLGMFLSDFCENGISYSVAAVENATVNSFEQLLQLLKRRIRAAERMGYAKAVRDLPII